MKLYKIGIYVGEILVYTWEGCALSIDQAREFAYEDFEINTYTEELED